MTTTAPAFHYLDGSRLRLPERLPPVEWCRKNVRLSDDPARPYWDPKEAPFACDVIEWFADSVTEEVWMCWPSQAAGKTTTMLCCYAYDRASGNAYDAMWVADQEPTLQDVTIPRMRSVFTGNPTLAAQLDPGKRSIGMYGVRFRRGSLFIAVAESEGRLSARTCARTFADEVDKWPGTTRLEGSPVDQLRARRKRYGKRGKGMYGSTPTHSKAAMWRARAECRVYSWMVRDPGSGKLEPWRVVDGLKFTEKPENVTWREWYNRATAGQVKFWYEFPSGYRSFSETERRDMNLAGRWVVTQDGPEHRKFTHLNCLGCMPASQSYELVGREWLRCLACEEEGDPAPKKSFFIHYVCEPVDEQESRVEIEELTALERETPRNVLPEGTGLVAIGCDVQHNRLWWCAIAMYGAENLLRVVGCGELPGELETGFPVLLRMRFRDAQGNTPNVRQLLLVDSGEGIMRDRVYSVTAMAPTLSIPIKGADTSQTGGQPFRQNKVLDGPDAGRLFTLDVGTIKDRLRSELTRERLTFFAGAHEDPTLFDHWTSEQRQTKPTARGVKSIWSPKPGRPENHQWDCATYARAGIWIMARELHTAVGVYGAGPQATVSTGPRRRGSPGWGGGFYH